MVTLGTGVGGGIIVGGKILTGSHGAGGEIGHLRVNPHETESCGCGGKGCLEQYASATGIVRLAKKKTGAGDKKHDFKTGNDLSAKSVFDAVKADDSVAKEICGVFRKLSWTCSCKSGSSDRSVHFCDRRRGIKSRRDSS